MEEKITEHDKAVIAYITAFREKKNFHEKTMDALAVLAGSAEGKRIFGSTTVAYQKLTEIVRECNDEHVVIERFTGYFDLG